MKKNYFFAFFLVLLCAGIMEAQIDVITPEQLVTLIETDENLVILDASEGKNYLASHIENAVHINHEDLYETTGTYGIIKSWIDLAEIFGNHGVNKNSTVVVYDEGSQKYASRVYWILKYIAKSNVKVLHKDVTLWEIDGIPTTAEATPVKPGNMSPGVMPSIYISIEEIDQRLGEPDFALIDVRTIEEFKGEKDSKGHIPGSIHLNYKDLMEDNGAFKSHEELAAIAESLGLNERMEVVFYCKEGIRACAAFVAFRNILGYRNAKVYDGSYYEWTARDANLQ